ncbi:hypothetical protein FOC1_g10016500 [Fusarium oxysporum f. sp. cubense race 1]|uniref:Uncharacterized protein n=1 Tax=Fusarium oxysporum f. sp. cubense (strain race 1) TaxID=1229664 RepID=N4TYM6_FUSC1|nr:hypothetical protein FOC1_g10016500 [Fusarium oxysporum f. sp. cubense race 1]
MVQLSTDAIVTIISTIPGLLISCLSAWFAYAALRRRHVNRNDIETATIEFIIAQISATPLRYGFHVHFCQISVNPA